MLLTFAFSARNFIKDVGSYAGFASVIALALFALLLFAQAREIKRLREWGSQAHDRIGELERSVAAALDMARRAVARPAAPAQAPVQPARAASRRAVGPAGAAAAAAGGAAARVASTSAPVRPELLPAAPVGLAGPPLASATVLIPLPGAPSSTGAPSVPMRAATPAGRPAVGVGGATTAAAAIDQRDRVVPDNGSNGHHDDPPTEFPPPLRATPAPAAARPAAGGPPRRPAGPAGARPRPGGRPQPAGAARGGNGARGGAQEPQEARHGRRRFGAILLVILALVVVGAAAFLLLGNRDDATTDPVRVETPSGGATRARRQASRRQATTRAATPAPPHGDTSVVVLNGTGQTGLAGRVMTELTDAGYPAGPVGDASSSNRPSTAVSFRAGAESAAREVARTLGISTDAVTEIDTDTETAACVLQDPCTAEVVVTVGADHTQP